MLELRDPIWPQGQTRMPCPVIIVPIWRSVDLLAGFVRVGLHCKGRRYVVQLLLIHGLVHPADQERIRVDATCVALLRQAGQGLDVGHVGAKGL